MQVVISGTGLFTPEHVISNEELVESFNRYVDHYNNENKNQIASGEIKALDHSSTAFIEKASGIKQRYVLNKSGILDPKIMRPQFKRRPDNEPSLMCEIALSAAKKAMENAQKSADDIDLIIVACSNMQRAYPAIAIEVQAALGISAFAFDMNVACSSATFALQQATDAIRNQSARSVLIVNPEICSGHLNFRNRDCHFIFGDACTAMIVEDSSFATSNEQYRILGTKLLTQFSNNIRNNFGFLSPSFIGEKSDDENLFRQEGRKVFKEVVPIVIKHLQSHLDAAAIKNEDIKRLYLHQANQHMNDMIAKKVMGNFYTEKIAPQILDRYANTSSAGSIISFHKHKYELEIGDYAIICSFGAGYSVGSVLIDRI